MKISPREVIEELNRVRNSEIKGEVAELFKALGVKIQLVILFAQEV